jgi:hypothetical protein
LARSSIYAAKRLCCGPGEERRDPTKQFYIKLFFSNTVILVNLLVDVLREPHGVVLDTPEDRRVITGPERSAARALGECVRTEHDFPGNFNVP